MVNQPFERRPAVVYLEVSFIPVRSLTAGVAAATAATASTLERLSQLGRDSLVLWYKLVVYEVQGGGYDGGLGVGYK